MKSRKVLFGLFAGLFALLSGAVFAQSNAGTKIVEIGPENIGGRITSLIVDQSDASHRTLYAGAATGGLYVRSNNSQVAQYPEIWNYVPYVNADGEQRVLPISHMVQLPDNTILIATGEGCFTQGTKFGHMASKGQGVFRFNPATKQFSRIEKTNPDNDTNWADVNRLAFAQEGNTLYVYAAVKGGLYRWVINPSTAETDWENPKLFITEEMFDVAVVKAYKMVYFAGKNKLFRLSSFNGDNKVDITSSNSAFANASRIQLAVSEKNPDYLYAMVSNASGRFNGLYLTTNQNSWTTISTPTVDPFPAYSALASHKESDNGFRCGAICIDAANSSRVFIGGTSLWEGNGYTDGAIFQWTQSSYSEKDFPTTNFMDDIYTNSVYVHSGINQIVQTEVTNDEGEKNTVFYIATNAGVFEGNSRFTSFANINRGLNSVQTNGVAVCTDGSLLIGSDYSADLFIESRQGHKVSSAVKDSSWYDPQGSGTNHFGNSYWYGNGGQVAASRFQQYSATDNEPTLERRVMFFSGYNGSFGRAMKDYTNYSNTQTWTTGTEFLGNNINSGVDVAQMQLWETENAKGLSSVTHRIDTNDIIFRDGQRIALGWQGDTAFAERKNITCHGTIRPTDTLMIPNVGTASYPFYTTGIDTTFENTFRSITRTIIITTNKHVLKGDTIRRDTVCYSSVVHSGTRPHMVDTNIITEVRVSPKYTETNKVVTDSLAERVLKGIDGKDSATVAIYDTTYKKNGFSITVDNPIRSHLFLLCRQTNSGMAGSDVVDKVTMSWNATDFTKVFETSEVNSRVVISENSVGWGEIYLLKSRAKSEGLGITTFGVSRDGDQAYIVIASSKKKDSCFVVRVKGMTSRVYYHKDYDDIYGQLRHEDSPRSYAQNKLLSDTLKYNGDIWFPRHISSIYVADGDSAIFTFEGHDNDFTNVMLVTKLSTDSDYTFIPKPVADKAPAYSALVEQRTRTVFIGTEEGLYTADKQSFRNSKPTWTERGEFKGVPITSLVQQQNDMPLRRYTQYEGFNVNNYIYPRTKFPYAIYIGTYGRGVFMDSTYVTNYKSEIFEERDYIPAGIVPVVKNQGANTISIYPNPASVRATIDMTVAKSGNAALRVYDLSGRVVIDKNLGRIAEGTYSYHLDCSGLTKGMYLVNLIVGGESAASKLVVR